MLLWHRNSFLKVDLEKAYDRVDWGFLKEVLQVTGFSFTFWDLIMECITRVSLPVSWNGESLEPFQPSQGLRHGDPLSPYLFVLCMEVSQKFQQVVNSKKWTAVTLGHGGPKISHIFFADEFLLFGRASFSQAWVMESMLVEFCEISE